MRNYLAQMKSRFTDIKQTKCAIFVNLTLNTKKAIINVTVIKLFPLKSPKPRKL